MTRIWIENEEQMNLIILELRKSTNWPLVGSRFIAWKVDDNLVLTIKQNKIGLFILRANGTLIATTPNEEVMIDFIQERLWAKSGIA